ncbi:MAG: hypothetical protein IJN90_06485 [Bacilli bacterium]|nr:hypothetical protein [Bacilli bacterium]
MIIKKDNYKEKLSKLTKDNFNIVTDFDRTITSSDSIATWGIINNRGILPNEYDFERNSLYNYYRPIELDPNLDEAVKMGAMEDWLNKHLDLFKKYELSKDNIIDVFSVEDMMTFRKGFLDFFKYVDDLNIPFNILSAGIGDFLLKFLEINNCSFVNIDVRSNFLKFDRKDIVIGFKGPIINSLNKQMFAYEKEDQDYVILLGDQVSDIMMVKGYPRENIIAIAFVPDDNMQEMESFKDVFDVVLTNDEGFDEILKDLKSVLDNK